MMEYYLSPFSDISNRNRRYSDGTIQDLMQGPSAKQLLDMPLGAKLPLLPGRDVVLYTTDLCEKLYHPSSGFNLGDPYCRLLETNYKNLHDPHLCSYFKRKDIQKRLKKGGFITSNNKIVCTLKEFNEYRQYLTSIKLDFERSYMKEQKMLEKQVAKLQGKNLIPEGTSTQLREWLLEEGKKDFEDKEKLGRNRYLTMLSKELEKIEHIAAEKNNLRLREEEKREQDSHERKLFLRKKMEEEWKTKEMLLLLRIGKDVSREAKIEEQFRKVKEDGIKKKQIFLERKMAYHLEKIHGLVHREQFETHKFGIAEQEKLLADMKKGYRLKNVEKERKLRRVERKWARLTRGACALTPKQLQSRRLLQNQLMLPSSKTQDYSIEGDKKGMKGDDATAAAQLQDQSKSTRKVTSEIGIRKQSGGQLSPSKSYGLVPPKRFKGDSSALQRTKQNQNLSEVKAISPPGKPTSIKRSSKQPEITGQVKGESGAVRTVIETASVAAAAVAVVAAAKQGKLDVKKPVEESSIVEKQASIKIIVTRRPVLHSDLVPIPPFHELLQLSEEEFCMSDITRGKESGGNDSDSQTTSHSERFDQNELSDLIRDLNLSKESFELLAYRLKENNVLQLGMKITFY
uniref:Fibrous sheath-interacting protein 2-like n=1 Tax=Geotrypetes seraphini TaxID=260995 RepID=A0A6P8RKU5_GEOSA|nr:fibrous sheath-interacting protein 2-like [Geotrypetes seraphini]